LRSPRTSTTAPDTAVLIPRPPTLGRCTLAAAYGFGVIRTRVYRNGTCADEDIDPARISDVLEEDGTIVWMDVAAPNAEEFALIAEEFSLNPLAVEDALHERQRPKLDHYDDHVFISLYDVHLDHDSGELVAAELAVFAAERYLITVRKSPNMSPDEVVTRCSRWTPRSRSSRTCCSTTASAVRRSSGARSSCASRW
jgi:Mg2+ and Co2+ transporter CorA